MKTNDLTKIAITVAALIVGGYAIYFVSAHIPLPGMKYTVMAPFLSMLMGIALVILDQKYSVLWINLVFGCIMFLVNPYMGVSIILVGLLTQMSAFLIPEKCVFKKQAVAALYSAFVASIALSVSFLFIASEIYETVSLAYIFLLGGLGFALGWVGAGFGVYV